MKSNRLMIASVMMLMGIAVIGTSCKKEQVATPKGSHKIEMTTTESLEKNDPDEDPYIRVRVKKKHSLTPVDNVTVDTYTYGTNVLVGSKITDIYGEAKQVVANGIYYLKITLPGTTTAITTDTIHVGKDVTTDLLVD